MLTSIAIDNDKEINRLKLLCNYPTVDINKQNKKGETALAMVCNLAHLYSGITLGRLEAIQILLNAGADPEIADNNGFTAIKVLESVSRDLFTQEKLERLDQAKELLQNTIDKKHNKLQAIISRNSSGTGQNK